MAAVEGEVDLAAALDRALDAKARAMRQVEARVVDRDVRALREERGREALDRQALVRTSLQGGAAVRLQIARICARAGKAHVEGDTAREVRELRDVRSRLLRVDIAADEMSCIRQTARRERTLAAHCAAESADRDILHRDAPAFIADVCARIRERDAIGRAGSDADITVDDGILHRPRDGRLERRRALIGDITEHLGGVKGIRGDAKVEIRGIRVVADLAADVRLLTIRVSIGREQCLRIREGDETVDVVDWRLLDRDGAALVFCLPREGELAAHVLARDLCLLHCTAANLDAVRDCPLRQQWQDIHDVESCDFQIENLALLAVGPRKSDGRIETVCLGRELQHGIVREISRALDVLRRDLAALRRHRDRAVLHRDRAEERARARALRLDVLDVPAAVLALDEVCLDIRERDFLDDVGRVAVCRKQAELHPGRISLGDAFRLLIIDGKIMNLKVMKRIHLDGADGDRHTERLTGYSGRRALYFVHERAGLYVVPDAAQYQQQHAKKRADAYPDGFPFHDDLPKIHSCCIGL